MEDLLNQLRALGVHIPPGLDPDQLLRLAGKLCPWQLRVEPDPGQVGTFRAYTRADLTGDIATAEQPAMAAYLLLFSQLEQGKYTAFDTAYKQTAESYRTANS